jgi:4-hydroxy-L-threonine phosphate dehydrogenase PdxA
MTSKNTHPGNATSVSVGYSPNGLETATIATSAGDIRSIGAQISPKSQLSLEGENADIIMNGVSLKDTLNAISDRLAVLQPKPELLAKYEALQQAYNHYKTLEALLHEGN